MSAPVAFCPTCKNEVVFLNVGNSRRCPLCGFQYDIGHATTYFEPSSETMSFLGALLRVFLIMIAIVVVAVGVLFVGCVTALKF